MPEGSPPLDAVGIVLTGSTSNSATRCATSSSVRRARRQQADGAYDASRREMGRKRTGLRERQLHWPAAGHWHVADRREIWSLEADGRLRVAITMRSSDDGST